MGDSDTKPIMDFTSYIADSTPGFTGREWVFRAINEWLAKSKKSRFFLLTGESGSGKTAIASRLYEITHGQHSPPDGSTSLISGFLSAVHFCSARDLRWIDPHVFSRSIAL